MYEVELKFHVTDATAQLESLAAALGCTHAERRSYLELLLGDGWRSP